MNVTKSAIVGDAVKRWCFHRRNNRRRWNDLSK